jgi:integrase
VAQVTSELVQSFLTDVSNRNPRTADVYKYYLLDFDAYCKLKHGIDIDSMVSAVLAGKYDVYKIASGFVNWLIETKYQKKVLTARTLSFRIKTVRQFLEVNDVPINRPKWNQKIRTPRPIQRESNPITKEEIRQLLQNTEAPELKTYLLFLASTGWRAAESIMLQMHHFDFTKKPIRVNVPGELTKTGQDRHTYLTEEMAAQLDTWLNYKYRERKIKSLNRTTGKWETRVLKPVKSDTDYVFMQYYDKKTISPNPKRNYSSIRSRFAEILKKLKIPMDKSGKRHKITFHSLRRFAYTQIDSLGMNQFAEYYIGHSHSTYWERSEQDKLADFKKVEPYLTFLDFNQLEAATQDVKTQLGALKYENLQLKGQIAELIPLKQQIEDIKAALAKQNLEIKQDKSIDLDEYTSNAQFASP